MADDQEFKIKGAASRSAEEAEEPEQADEKTVVKPDAEPYAAEEGEIVQETNDGDVKENEVDMEQQEEDLRRYRWLKCLCDPLQYQGRDHYFLQMDTNVSQWEEPDEPYWIYDAAKEGLDDSGLQYPSSKSAPNTSEPDPNYTGYNPKIHGHYDPTAPYAQYHEQKREQEAAVQQAPHGMFTAAPGMDYATAGTFNRFTGDFQSADQTADRHNDFNKSGRQMGAYFDVDAAANAHDGRSLKEERRNEKLSKKQIKELADKRRAKKEKKRMDFYKS